MYPEPYIQYLVHFHGDRDYFECHEVLEEYWKEISSEGKQSIWVGLILLAVSNYHYRRKNLTGAERTLSKAISIFQETKQISARLSIDVDKLLSFLSKRLQHIQTGLPYSSFNIPLVDQDLLNCCQAVSSKKGLTWGKESDLSQEEIIHRHTLRDRSDVFREREKAIFERNKKEGREFH